MSLCTVEGCLYFGQYCRIHPAEKAKKKYRIPPRSKKTAKVMKEQYVPEVIKMIEQQTECKVKAPGCSREAQGFHHLKGRSPKLLTDKKYLIPCCNSCNLYIEVNDKWARARGFKLSKFTK